MTTLNINQGQGIELLIPVGGIRKVLGWNLADYENISNYRITNANNHNSTYFEVSLGVRGTDTINLIHWGQAIELLSWQQYAYALEGLLKKLDGALAGFQVGSISSYPSTTLGIVYMVALHPIGIGEFKFTLYKGFSESEHIRGHAKVYVDRESLEDLVTVIRAYLRSLEVEEIPSGVV